MKRLHVFILILTTSPNLGRSHRLGAPHGDGQGVGGPPVERQMRRLFNDDSEKIEDILYGDKKAETKWWNGESNGKECSPGVYFFIFHAKTINGKTFNSRGTVTLIR